MQKETDAFVKKRYKGQRKDKLSHLEHVKKIYRRIEDDRLCDTCETDLVVVGEEFARFELEFIPAQI